MQKSSVIDEETGNGVDSGLDFFPFSSMFNINLVFLVLIAIGTSYMASLVFTYSFCI